MGHSNEQVYVENPCTHRCFRLNKGDTFFVVYNDGDPVLSAGDKFEIDNAVVSQVLTERRRWWQFWKKPSVLGYKVMVL